MAEKLITIGHICADTVTDSEDVIGGGVTYSGLAASKLGIEVDILTKVPPSHRFITDLRSTGITVLNLPSQQEGITTFTNRYDEVVNRQQSIAGRQEEITSDEILDTLTSHEANTYFLYAPIISEIDMTAIPELSKRGKVAITPQGYFRQSDETGKIFQKDWTGFEEPLAYADLVVLSEEDISQGGIQNENLLDRIKKSAKTTVLTRGPRGATIFQSNGDSIDIASLILNAGEAKDFTGAGDTFAASYISKLMKGASHHEAGVFAAYFAGVKITGVAGSGVNSIPDTELLSEYARQNPEKIAEFLKANGASEDFLTMLPR